METLLSIKIASNVCREVEEERLRQRKQHDRLRREKLTKNDE